MKNVCKKFKVGALVSGVAGLSMFGGVGCNTAYGVPTDTQAVVSSFGLNEGWVFRGNGHDDVKVFTKNYPSGTACVVFNNDGNVETSLFFKRHGNIYGMCGFNPSQLDPAIAHLFYGNNFWFTSEFKFSNLNGVTNVSVAGVNFTL